MKSNKLPKDFYEKIKPRLERRIGRELRLAYRILDLGCGSCGLAQFLRRRYRQRVTGVDISDSSFPRHDAPSQKRNPLRCIKADAAHLDFVRDGAVDAVVSMWALHEMKDAEGILHEVWRVLRPGGRILILDFPRGSLAQRLWNEEYYRTEEIHDILQQAGFEEVRARTIERGQVIWATGLRPPLKQPSRRTTRAGLSTAGIANGREGRRL